MTALRNLNKYFSRITITHTLLSGAGKQGIVTIPASEQSLLDWYQLA
jgi:hypothetical protein